MLNAFYSYLQVGKDQTRDSRLEMATTRTGFWAQLGHWLAFPGHNIFAARATTIIIANDKCTQDARRCKKIYWMLLYTPSSPWGKGIEKILSGYWKVTGITNHILYSTNNNCNCQLANTGSCSAVLPALLINGCLSWPHLLPASVSISVSVSVSAQVQVQVSPLQLQLQVHKSRQVLFAKLGCIWFSLGIQMLSQTTNQLNN